MQPLGAGYCSPAPIQQQQPDRSAVTCTQAGITERPGSSFSCELPAGAPSLLRFPVPVDEEHKALQLQLLRLSRPHMMAFHLSWVCLFVTFTTTFAPAALLPVLQDALDLTRTDISNAGIASVCGTIASRVAMGAMTDALGPRYSAAIALLGTAPLMFGMALMRTAAAFIALRMLVGLGLSMFVVNQTWMGAMFNRKVVGRASALSAGWGNMGFGATLLLMPLLYETFSGLWGPQVAWRAALMVPGCLQLMAGVAVLVLGDDTPQGRLPQLDRRWCRPCSGGSCRLSSCTGLQALLLSPRPYLLAAAYAACFGVEITVANTVSLYLFNQFHLSLTAAGLMGGCLGFMNLFSRFAGGAASDAAARRRGMVGRMWVLLLLLLLEGAFCLLVGISHDSLAATLAMLFLFSFFGQMACGAVFGITPFLSHRYSGLAVGLVAAGGNVGSAVFQALFFSSLVLTAYEGFYWMGATVLGLGTLCCALLYWPPWGGLCCSSNPSINEERFYLSEYSGAERVVGLHVAVLAFAHETHKERNPHAGRSCSGCGNAFPAACASCSSCLMRLPVSGCTCCFQHTAGGNSSSSSRLADSHAAVSQFERQQQNGKAGGGSASPAVAVDAAVSAASTSSHRNSGSSHGRASSQSSALH